jgi:hypothetical protein
MNCSLKQFDIKPEKMFRVRKRLRIALLFSNSLNLNNIRTKKTASEEAVFFVLINQKFIY